MNVDALVRALADDLAPVAHPPRVGRRLARFALACAAMLVIFTRGGLALHGSPAAFPIAASLAALAAASFAAVLSSIPGRTTWPMALVATLSVGAWCGDLIVSAASLPTPWSRWGTTPWPNCFVFTVAAAAIPTAVLVRLVGRGWAVRPRAAGALSFLAGFAAGGLTISLECPSNAPLHVLVGHALPVVLGLLGGFVTGRHLLGPRIAPPHRPAGQHAHRIP